MGIGGTLAFAMEVSEFAIVQISSSLTLSIIGVTKVLSKLSLIGLEKGKLITTYDP